MGLSIYYLLRNRLRTAHRPIWLVTPKEVCMTEPLNIARQYIQVWNEKDPGRRRQLLAETWVEDALYVDPLAHCAGFTQIDAMIAAVQAKFPTFRFSLCGGADGHGDHVRFSWVLGPEVGAGPIKGTDVIVLEAGRMKSVIGFLDEIPAGG
jgi:SnoaL-like domain